MSLRKIFHLEIKSENYHKYYGGLSALCSENPNLGISKFTLDRDVSKIRHTASMQQRIDEAVSSLRKVLHNWQVCVFGIDIEKLEKLHSLRLLKGAVKKRVKRVNYIGPTDLRKKVGESVSYHHITEEQYRIEVEQYFNLR